MAIVTHAQLKDWARVDGGFEDATLTRLMASAQDHIEQLLGYRIEENFGGEGQEPVPPSLVEAVLQLATWWYGMREAAVEGETTQEVPFGVSAIVREFRGYTF